MKEYDPPLKINSILKFFIVLAGVIWTIIPLGVLIQLGLTAIQTEANGHSSIEGILNWPSLFLFSFFFLVGISLIMIHENIRYSISLLSISCLLFPIMIIIYAPNLSASWLGLLFAIFIPLKIFTYEIRRLKKAG